MIYFIGGTLLKEEPCKSILKYDIKNYFRQFRGILSIFYFSEIQNTQTW